MLLQLTIRFDATTLQAGQNVTDVLLQRMFEMGTPVHGSHIEQVNSETAVYTDGGCDREKDGIGAWAFIVTHPNGKVEEFCEPAYQTTNNRMEMTAVIKALEALEIGPPVTIYCDSSYVIQGTTVWSRNWVRNGWRNVQGQPVINQDLWQVLLSLYKLHNATFKQVKGHSGVVLNERCDALCTAAMIEAHKEVLKAASASKAS